MIDVEVDNPDKKMRIEATLAIEHNTVPTRNSPFEYPTT